MMYSFYFDNNENVVIAKIDIAISLNDVLVKEIDFEMKIENF